MFKAFKKIVFILLCIAVIQWFEKPKTSQAKTQVIHLNYNESPYRPFEKSIQNAVFEINKYPDEPHQRLINQIASYHSISTDQILVSNGLSSLLRTIAEAYLKPENTLIVAYPTFEYLEIYAANHGANVIKVPLNKDYEHDLEAILAKADASTTLVYICNPNNPTGTITPRKKIEEFINKLPSHTLVLIDEAYHHFADSKEYQSFIDKPISDPRIIVGRTFSKAYGMAGGRLGYIVASPHIIKKLTPYEAFDATNTISLEAGIAALKDEASLKKTMHRIISARESFYLEASLRGIKTIPSQGNFVMLDLNGKSITEVIKHFANNKILVGRPFPPYTTHLRVSIGQPADMTAFWKAWDQMAKGSQ